MVGVDPAVHLIDAVFTDACYARVHEAGRIHLTRSIPGLGRQECGTDGAERELPMTVAPDEL